MSTTAVRPRRSRAATIWSSRAKALLATYERGTAQKTALTLRRGGSVSIALLAPKTGTRGFSASNASARWFANAPAACQLMWQWSGGDCVLNSYRDFYQVQTANNANPSC
jgi:hypothetical protein